MKRTIAVIILVVVIGSMLTAAGIRTTQSLQGTLRWTRGSVCGVSDYVSLPVMDNVFLTGKFVPTNGLVQGCTLNAMGSAYTVGSCQYFAVDRYSIACDHSSSGGHR